MLAVAVAGWVVGLQSDQVELKSFEPADINPQAEKLQSDQVELKSLSIWNWLIFWLASIGPGGIEMTIVLVVEVFGLVLQSDQVELKYYHTRLLTAYNAKLQSDQVELKCRYTRAGCAIPPGFNRTRWN